MTNWNSITPKQVENDVDKQCISLENLHLGSLTLPKKNDNVTTESKKIKVICQDKKIATFFDTVNQHDPRVQENLVLSILPDFYSILSNHNNNNIIHTLSLVDLCKTTLANINLWKEYSALTTTTTVVEPIETLYNQHTTPIVNQVMRCSRFYDPSSHHIPRFAMSFNLGSNTSLSEMTQQTKITLLALHLLKQLTSVIKTFLDFAWNIINGAGIDSKFISEYKSWWINHAKVALTPIVTKEESDIKDILNPIMTSVNNTLSNFIENGEMDNVIKQLQNNQTRMFDLNQAKEKSTFADGSSLILDKFSTGAGALAVVKVLSLPKKQTASPSAKPLNALIDFYKQIAEIFDISNLLKTIYTHIKEFNKRETDFQTKNIPSQSIHSIIASNGQCNCEATIVSTSSFYARLYEASPDYAIHVDKNVVIFFKFDNNNNTINQLPIQIKLSKLITIDYALPNKNHLAILTHINPDSSSLITNKKNTLHILNMLKHQFPLLWIYSYAPSGLPFLEKCLLLHKHIGVITFWSDNSELIFDTKKFPSCTDTLYIATSTTIESVNLNTFESKILLNYEKIKKYDAVPMLQNSCQLIIYGRGGDYFVVRSPTNHIAFGQFTNLDTINIFKVNPEEHDSSATIIHCALFGSLLAIGFSSGIVIFWDILEHCAYKHPLIPPQSFKDHLKDGNASKLYKLTFCEQTQLRFYCYDGSYISWKLKL